MSQDGEQAVIKVALEPDAAKEIPENVGVQIIPTTLFGQKFISFVAPERPVDRLARRTATSSRPTASRPTSSSARSWPTCSRCCGPCSPPTSTPRSTRSPPRSRAAASSSAQTLDQLDAYLGAISDKLPTLKQDLVSLANVADTYDLAAPDLIGVLGNLTVTSKTIIEKADDLDVFFSDLAGPGRHLDPGAVGQRAEPDPGRPGHRAGAQAARDVLAGVPLPASRAPPRTHRAWPAPSRATRSSSTSSSAPPSTRPTTPTTARSYGEVGHGPWCYGLPNPKVPSGPGGVRRGHRHRREPARPATCPAHQPAVPRRPRPAATRAPTPRRRSSTLCSRARPAARPTRTAPSGRCSTARSSGAVATRDHDAGAAGGWAQAPRARRPSCATAATPRPSPPASSC